YGALDSDLSEMLVLVSFRGVGVVQRLLFDLGDVVFVVADATRFNVEYDGWGCWYM
ncbi:hypothetical protein A2U01_0059390, partial [Trifolium medium]|nr:hypothetical protein [Trifolium medium]